VFFREMDIPNPDYNLAINSLSHGAMTGQMLQKLEEVMIKEQPDKVVVYGDTNSTLAGALAAVKLHIPVAHIEAGLRSFNMQMPEEVNRILTDRISKQLFCPTDSAVNNLGKEGFDNIDCEIVRTGDIMYDAALYYAQKASERSTVINTLKLSKNKYLLVTLHRAENTDDINRLTNICNALNALTENYDIVLPLHPRTKKIIEQTGIKLLCTVIDPVGYFDMIELIRNSELVLTDSGGLQKEAYFFKKYCVTLRDQTEWVELVDNGYNKLAGASQQNIIDCVYSFAGKEFSEGANLYGTGSTSEDICKHLVTA
jgi:UDP-GlcNAc3NAcA epimerase